MRLSLKLNGVITNGSSLGSHGGYSMKRMKVRMSYWLVGQDVQAMLSFYPNTGLT
jgi:hypothetical protein|tara:strand:- start:134 stop:298 length:165 start_codon:yes stop_codon:yes gene_type:complete